MWLKNNSETTWENYNCGNDFTITIKPNSTFEVEDRYGEVLLKNLGHENWLVISQDPRTVEEKKELEIKTEEIEKEEVIKKEIKKEESNLNSFLKDNANTSGKI